MEYTHNELQLLTLISNINNQFYYIGQEDDQVAPIDVKKFTEHCVAFIGDRKMMTYENWLNSCPNPMQFAMDYVDIKSDVLNVIDTYDREEWDTTKIDEEFIKDICYQVYDQDWSEWNDFIAYLIDNKMEEKIL